MNILFVLPQIQKGGGQAIQALNLAEQLMKKDNRIFFLTFKTKETSEEIRKYLKKFRIYYFNIHLNYFTILSAPFLVNKVKKLVQDWKIDVIQSFDPHLSNLFAVLLRKKMKIPVICRIGARHRDFYENKLLTGNFLMKLLYYTKIPSTILKILEYYTIKRTKITVGNSYYLLDALKQSFLLKFHSFKWRIIPNGIDLEKFSPNKEVPLNISKKFEKKNVILFVGRVDDFKGVDSVIRALALVKPKIPDLHLLVIGSYQFNYHYFEKLRFLVEKLKLTQEVSFFGEIPHIEIPYYLTLSKILIYPSYSTSRPFFEGCPSVILEGMATQRLVIASNIGGIPEIIQHKKNGLLFEPKHYLQIAKLILSTWRYPKKFKRIAENGRKSIIEKYAFEIIVKKYLKVYNWSLKSGV